MKFVLSICTMLDARRAYNVIKNIGGYPSKVAELLRCMYPSIVATNRTLGVRLVRTPSVRFVATIEGWIWKNI